MAHARSSRTASGEDWSRRLKQACRAHAIEAWEDAQIRGLCAQGAFEVAMQAILDTPVEDIMSASSGPSSIVIKRVYEPVSDDDGLRVLVDRLWPRGIAKSEASWNHWLKDLAPSDELRKWFNHDAEKWKAFGQKYRTELKAHHDDLIKLLDEAKGRSLTLLYSAKDTKHNQAVILQSVLQQLQKKRAHHA